MSRYLLLILVNTPIVVAGIIECILQYKLKKISVRVLVIRLIAWSTIFIGLIAAEPLYKWLYSQQLTKSEPLSLFDVVQITAIILMLSMISRLRSQSEENRSQINNLNTAVSIQLSEKHN